MKNCQFFNIQSIELYLSDEGRGVPLTDGKKGLNAERCVCEIIL